MFINRVTFATLMVVVMGAVSTLADLSINNPVAGTKWVAGKQATITWIPAGDGYDTEAKWTVELVRGDDEISFRRVAVLGTAKETAGKLTFTVPKDLPSDDNYAVRIGERYSHTFEISNSALPATKSTKTATPTSSPTLKKSDKDDDEGKNGTTTSTTSTSSPTSTPTDTTSGGSTANNQPFVMTGSLLALVPVVVMAMWGF
jgi:hypothetical protein